MLRIGSLIFNENRDSPNENRRPQQKPAGNKQEQKEDSDFEKKYAESYFDLEELRPTVLKIFTKVLLQDAKLNQQEKLSIVKILSSIIQKNDFKQSIEKLIAFVDELKKNKKITKTSYVLLSGFKEVKRKYLLSDRVDETDFNKHFAEFSELLHGKKIDAVL